MPPKKHTQPPRRKPLAADITMQNAQRDRIKRTEAAHRRHERTPGWDDLHALYADCSGMFKFVPDLATIIRSEAVRLHIGSRERDLIRMAKELTRDVETYMSSLAAIYSRHKDNHGDETNLDRNMELMQIGMEYQSWADSFQSVVIAKAADISDLITSLTTTPEVEHAANT